jgi:hypothetical protein
MHNRAKKCRLRVTIPKATKTTRRATNAPSTMRRKAGFSDEPGVRMLEKKSSASEDMARDEKGTEVAKVELLYALSR